MEHFDSISYKYFESFVLVVHKVFILVLFVKKLLQLLTHCIYNDTFSSKLSKLSNSHVA